jgi:hypothetical protein
MATTVKDLIKQLQEEHGSDEPIIFQYVVADHTDLDSDTFEEVADYLMGNDQFGEDTTEVFKSWITEALDIVQESAEEE